MEPLLLLWVFISYALAAELKMHISATLSYCSVHFSGRRIDSFASELPSLKFSLFQFIMCGILNLAVAPFLDGPLVLAEGVFTHALIPILYCGIFSVGVAYTCQVIGQRGTEPALASIILCTESVFAAIGEPIIDKSAAPLTIIGYLGCALIFAGILLSQTKLFKK